MKLLYISTQILICIVFLSVMGESICNNLFFYWEIPEIIISLIYAAFTIIIYLYIESLKIEEKEDNNEKLEIKAFENYLEAL